MNTKLLIIFRDEVVHDEKSQLRKYGDIDLVVAQADLVQQHHHDPPQSYHTAVGRIAASTTCCVRTIYSSTPQYLVQLQLLAAAV